MSINKLDFLKQHAGKIIVINNEKHLLNMFALGVITTYMKYKETDMLNSLENNIDKKFLAENFTAFMNGKKYFKEMV